MLMTRTVLKVCSKCKQSFLPTTDNFYQDKRAKDGLQCWCKKCMAAYRKVYDKTPERKKVVNRYRQTSKGKKAVREGKLRFRHGSGAVELWNSFFAKQGGTCLGCGKHQSELECKLSLDHDHETGEYRGLLCKSCNIVAGSSEAHVQVLKNLVKYLESFYAC